MILNGATKTGEASDANLAELVDRFIDRFQAGEWVDARAFAAEHPAHAEALLELLPAAATMATVRRSFLQSEGQAAHFRLDSDMIGGYRIVREIGRGGMGVVYEAVQVATGRKVALKVLPIAAATDPRQIERFRIEGQAAAALDHPHIVPVSEIGCEQGVHFYAMRLVEGCSLAAVVLEAQSGTSPAIMTPREAARLALQAAEALAHAHDLGILHRDIKPANLLVDPAGHLWVTDFGLAHFLGGGDLTQTGDVIGTLRYLSPEQARGRRKLDGRTDVYSLGATLYELATLRPAFDGHDRQELLRQIASDEPIPPRRLDPTIPRDLETILVSAMAKEVEDRYGSATELADDLRRFLDGRPIVARRPSTPTKAARWARRNKVTVAIATTVLSLFLLGTAIGVGLLWREQIRTRENLRLALIALDEFCLSTTGPELTRDPERTQQLQTLQLKALTIYERMLRQNPGDRDDAMGRRPCRAPDCQYPGPVSPLRRGRAGFSSRAPEPDRPARTRPPTSGISRGSGRHPCRLGGGETRGRGASQEAAPAGPRGASPACLGVPRRGETLTVCESRLPRGGQVDRHRTSHRGCRERGPVPPGGRAPKGLGGSLVRGQGRAGRSSGLPGPSAQRDEPSSGR